MKKHPFSQISGSDSTLKERTAVSKTALSARNILNNLKAQPTVKCFTGINNHLIWVCGFLSPFLTSLASPTKKALVQTQLLPSENLHKLNKSKRTTWLA